MLSNKIEKFRDRKFALLLYPDDATHVKALELITQSYDCAYILHDRDIDQNGDLKKKHYHVVVRTGNNAKWNTSLAKDLGITLNYIQQVKNMNRALEYLIHFNDPDKYQYKIDDVYGILKNRLNELINSVDKSEGEKMIEIIEFINEYDGYLKTSTLIVWCAKNGCYDVCRRGGSLLTRALDEHNFKYREELDLYKN